MMQVPFNDFKSHYAAVREAVDPAVQRVLQSGWYILGAEVKAFESSLAAWLGGGECIGVASGTEAITLALMALELRPGDEVLTTALTAYPTITGIKQAGAVPVVVDIDPATGLLDPRRLSRWISDRTRAIVPVHLYGQSCDMDAIGQFAATHKLAIVEDCAQSIGATWGDRPTGTFGAFGCFSFYPTKNLGAFGDGGAIFTRSAEQASKLRSLRNHGQTSRYHHDLPGLNSRLDEMQAAILAAKLPSLHGWNQRRRQLAQRYSSQLRGVQPLTWHHHGEPVCHLYPVLSDHRDALMAHLLADGIGTLIHYPVPVPRQGDFEVQHNVNFPAAEYMAARVFSLPLYPEMTDDQVDAVCRSVNAFSP